MSRVCTAQPLLQVLLKPKLPARLIDTRHTLGSAHKLVLQAPLPTTTLSQSDDRGDTPLANCGANTVAADGQHLNSSVQSKTANNPAKAAKVRPSHTATVVSKRRRLLVAPFIRGNNSTSAQLTAVKPSQQQACSSSSCREAAAASSSLQQSPRVACRSSHAGQDGVCLQSAVALSSRKTQLTSHDSSITSNSSSTLLHAPSCAVASLGVERFQARPDNSAKISGQQQQLNPMFAMADAETVQYLTPKREGPAKAKVVAAAPAEALSQSCHTEQNSKQTVCTPQQAPQCVQSHNKKNKPSQQDNSPGKPAAAAYDSPHHVSDVPNGKQDDLGHLLQVQRLPAISSASLPSAEYLGVSLNLPTAGAMIGQLAVQSTPASAMTHAASNLVAKRAMSNLTSCLKPEAVTAAMHTSLERCIIKAQEVLNVVDASALQVVTKQLEPLLDKVQELKLAAPINIIQHHVTAAVQSAPAPQQEHTPHTPYKEQLAEARPGSEVKYTATEAEGSHFGNATVHSMVAQQQYEFAELLQSPEKQAEEFENRQDDFAVSVHYLQAILGC